MVRLVNGPPKYRRLKTTHQMEMAGSHFQQNLQPRLWRFQTTYEQVKTGFDLLGRLPVSMRLATSAKKNAPRLGLQACLLANELRQRFSYPPFEPRYDIAGALKREVAEWNSRRS